MYDPTPRPDPEQAARKAREERVLAAIRSFLAAAHRFHILTFQYYRLAADLAAEHASVMPGLATAAKSLAEVEAELPIICRTAVDCGYIDPADPVLANVRY